MIQFDQRLKLLRDWNRRRRKKSRGENKSGIGIGTEIVHNRWRAVIGYCLEFLVNVVGKELWKFLVNGLT